MDEPAITTVDPVQAIPAWFDTFAEFVRAEAYDDATALVAEDVRSFGTKAELVEGRGHLVEEQWKQIWPNIQDFTFKTPHVRGTTELAWGAATWTSTGFDEQGASFHRPGRATITFDRRNERWLAVHTHFSLAPGIPAHTHGPAGSAE